MSELSEGSCSCNGTCSCIRCNKPQAICRSEDGTKVKRDIERAVRLSAGSIVWEVGWVVVTGLGSGNTIVGTAFRGAFLPMD
jgi:hypothetical protein